MRAFRMYRRVLRSGRIDKHRDYIGEDNLHKHGPATWVRYNHISKYTCKVVDYRYVLEEREQPVQVTRAELAEMIDGRWTIMPQEEAEKLIFKQQ